MAQRPIRVIVSTKRVFFFPRCIVVPRKLTGRCCMDRGRCCDRACSTKLGANAPDSDTADRSTSVAEVFRVRRGSAYRIPLSSRSSRHARDATKRKHIRVCELRPGCQEGLLPSLIKPKVTDQPVLCLNTLGDTVGLAQVRLQDGTRRCLCAHRHAVHAASLFSKAYHEEHRAECNVACGHTSAASR